MCLPPLFPFTHSQCPQPRWRPGPRVVDLVHVDTEWKHSVIKLDINEVISSTVVTRLRTGRGSPDHLTTGTVSPRELGGSPHDVVHCVRDAGVAAILRDQVHSLPHKLHHHIARVVLHPVTLSAHPQTFFVTTLLYSASCL